MDFSKAFETANHNLFLPKLKAYGFNEKIFFIYLKLS